MVVAPTETSMSREALHHQALAEHFMVIFCSSSSACIPVIKSHLSPASMLLYILFSSAQNTCPTIHYLRNSAHCPRFIEPCFFTLHGVPNLTGNFEGLKAAGRVIPFRQEVQNPALADLPYMLVNFFLPSPA